MKIANNLKLDDITTIIVFKGLDTNKKGKIRVEDFVVVIDSYREDNQFNSKSGNEDCKSNVKEKENSRLLNNLINFKSLFKENSITIDEIFTNSQEEYARIYEIFVAIKNVNKSIDSDCLEVVLNFLKREDNKVLKEDILNLIEASEIDRNYIINYIQSKKKTESRFALNDTQIYWINKLMALLEIIGLTPQMAFEMSVSDNKKKEINLDNFKRKLQKLIPTSRVTAIELNNIADCLDINKTKFLNSDDYNEIIDNSKNDPKFSIIMKPSDNLLGVTNNPVINSFVKTSKNFSELPVKGNTRALSALKSDINKTKNFPIEEKLSPTSKSTNNKEFTKEDKIITIKPTKQTNAENILIKEFLKDLEVFENGEWSLIELLEDMYLSRKGLLPIGELNMILVKKFFPTISKNKIFQICREIDDNKDGFFGYNNLISFCLNYLKHRSTKLALKEISRKIEYDNHLATEDFFARKMLQLNTEMNFVNFTQFFSKNFDIEPPIIKKIFQEIKSILSGRSNIFVSDIIDLINEYRTENDKNEHSKIPKNENISLSLLDKKFYEEEMKNFVRILQKGLCAYNINNPQEFSKTLENILDLPHLMRLSQFRERFIKPLSMNYSLGIATFQLLKKFERRDEAFINKEILFNLLESYLDPLITEMDPELILFLLENNFASLRLCFESIPMIHDFKGISTYDIFKQLIIFYPRINKKIIKSIVKSLDTEKLGAVTFKNLTDFIYKFSKRAGYSNDLMIKHVASILNYKKRDAREFIFKEMNLKKDDRLITYTDHNELFVNKLNFNNDQAHTLFLCLSDNCPIKDSYIIERLIRLINPHLLNVKKTGNMVYDNTSQIETVKSQQSEFTNFLRVLNEILKLSEVFDGLSIGETLNISIIDLSRVIIQNYKDIFEINRNLLMRFLKSIDNEKQGYIPYEKFLKVIRNYFNEFQPSVILHTKYVANKIHKEFEGNWKNYLNYKGLASNKFLSLNQFETIFNEECMGIEDISFKIFEMLKEKKGNNANMVHVQNLIDYLTNLVNAASLKVSDEDKNLCNEECEGILKSTILKLENQKNFYFRNIFDIINLKEVNQFGKINSEFMKNYFKEFTNLQDPNVKIFIKYFCKVLNLFDLTKFVEFLQTNSKKSRVNLESIIQKIIQNIPRDKTVQEYCKIFNINFHTPLNLTEFSKLLNALFKLSIYECFYLFNESAKSQNNPLKEEYKINIDFILQNYSLYSLFAKDLRNDSEKSKLDPATKISLQKLAIYLDSQQNKMKIFKEFDKDSNGVLNRNEFLNLMKSFKNSGLNESQLIKIINFADKNNDEFINYYEFVNMINEFQLDKNTSNTNSSKNYSKVNNKPSNEPKRISLIDLELLKQNYEFNSKNYEKRIEIPLESLIFQIQEEIFNTMHSGNNLENEMVERDKNNSNHINKDVFFDLLKNRSNLKNLINEEIEEKLWNFSMDGMNNNTKNKLLLEKLINYKLFFTNVTRFQFIIQNKEIQKKMEKENKPDIKNEFKSLLNINFKVNEKLKEKDTKIIYSFTKKMGEAIESNDDKTIENTKNLIFKGFTINNNTKETDINNKTNIPQSYPNVVNNFKEFITKITTLEYKGYDYTIDPNVDYYVRPDGTKVTTILNNEDAAIKKCEEILASIKDKEGFFDKDFGSQQNDNGTRNKTSLYITGTAPKGHIDPNMIDWYRMNQISCNPLFIANGEESNDVMQGALGDCWIISAFSVLATKSHLLRGEFKPDILDDGEIDNEEAVMLSTGVYPPIFHSFRKNNLYCFRFYKNFAWRYVIIDDRLPCRKVYNKNDPKKLIYGKCRSEDEFWVPLLEKAYAKLHGSYEALVSGFIDDGLVDLTGLTSRKVNIGKEELNNPQSADKLWELIKQNSSMKFNEDPLRGKNSNILKAQILTRNNSMIGCSVDAKVVESEVVHNNIKCGILAGHAYSILDTIEIPKLVSKKERHSSRLLRIRNPWGYKEWNGKWSDESSEIEKNKEVLQKAFDDKYADSTEKVQLDAEDGSFIMCFSDFRKIFTRLFLCIDFPNSFVGILFRDKWSKEESGGIPVNNTGEELKSWAKNPQYYIKLEKETNFYISLMQNDGRLTNKKFPYSDCTLKNCLIISSTKGKNKLTLFDGDKAIHISQIRQHRENSINCLLQKGEYIISACTFKAGEIGEFALELHFEDTFKDNNYNSTNFQEKLKNTYIERLGNVVQAEIKKETSIEEIQDVKQRKKELMYHQFKSLLIDEEKKLTSKGDPVENKYDKKKNEEEDDWEDY